MLFPPHSTELLLCYFTYLVTGPNPRGSLTGPELMTPAVNTATRRRLSVFFFFSLVKLTSTQSFNMEESKPKQDSETFVVMKRCGMLE